MTKGTVAGIIATICLFGLSVLVGKTLREKPTIISVFRED